MLLVIRMLVCEERQKSSQMTGERHLRKVKVILVGQFSEVVNCKNPMLHNIFLPILVALENISFLCFCL